MNKVFNNCRQAALLATTVILVSGCSSLQLTPNSKGESYDKGSSANDETVIPKRQMIVGNEHYLPKQQYNVDGTKIPYKAQPNPHLANKTPANPQAVAQFTKANRLMKQGQYKAATKIYTSLTEQYKSLSGPWVKLAEIALHQKQYQDAFAHYKNAINANPNNMKARLELALAYRSQGYFSEAQETYLSALKAWPDFAEAHYNLAILYDLYVNEPVAAQKHFQAYDFLTGSKDKKVKKWLVELQRRSGDKTNYIDQPPKPKTQVTPSAAVIADKS